MTDPSITTTSPSASFSEKLKKLKKKRVLQQHAGEETETGTSAAAEEVASTSQEAAPKKKSKKQQQQPHASPEEPKESVPTTATATATATATTTATTTTTSADEIKKILGQGAEVDTFEALDICAQTKAAVCEDLKFVRMTEIQQKAIPLLLSGKDVVGQAKTGSGKTLAFVIPCVELMVRTRFLVRNGTAVVVISPVRELCLQIHGVVAQVMARHPAHTHACCFGGQNPKHEVEKLTRGVNVLIATPGRLLDHLKNCRTFVYKNLLALVIDEADRILQQGFEEEMREIIKLLPKDRQTMLFSATQTTKVKDLIRMSFASPPVYVGVHDNLPTATCESLTQGYVVVPSERRFLLLYAFLRKFSAKKVIVFFSSCMEVQFFSELLNYVDVPCSDLHGRQKQQKRTNTFKQFVDAERGVLLCTDVAARGLDIPNVDWIVQYDPPDQPSEYIHRVGRTARAGKVGNALLFLLSEELEFLKYLKAYKVPLAEWEYPASKLPTLLQAKFQRLVETNYYLHKSARDAYRSYLLSYNSHQLKSIFCVANLDVKRVAASFGLSTPPTVNFNLCDITRRASAAHAGKKIRIHGSEWAQERAKAAQDTDPYGIGVDNKIKQ